MLLISGTTSCCIFRSDGTPLLTQHAAPDHRPFLHPLAPHDGVGSLTEDEPGHHPWQHGLYTGLNGVNGVGFWTEGKLPGHDHDGSFHPRPLEPPAVEGHRASWRVVSDWRDPEGRSLLTETQAWGLLDEGTRLLLDLTWTLRAAVDLTFAEYAYGGLFLRAPYRREVGGRAVVSSGLPWTEADGQRAEWVAVELPLPGREGLAEPLAHLAILDHPGNPEHPTPWRLDGQLGIGPGRCIAGAWSLPRGEEAVERYRLVAGVGPVVPEEIQAEWSRLGD